MTLSEFCVTCIFEQFKRFAYYQMMRLDNEYELQSTIFTEGFEAKGNELIYISPSKSLKNAFHESLNEPYQHPLLDVDIWWVELGKSLKPARGVSELVS